MPNYRWFLLILVSLTGLKAFAGLACTDLYSKKMIYEYKGLSQDTLGKDWAKDYKFFKVLETYNDWKKENPTLSVQDFILEYTYTKKSLPFYRLISGKERIHDRTHSLAALVVLAGTTTIRVWGNLEADYSQPNPATGKKWKKKQVMRDLNERGFTNFNRTSKPRYKDLERLPSNPWLLQNSPERSIVSFSLRELQMHLKGSDFVPQAQNQFRDALESYGFNLDLSRSGDPKYHQEIAKLIESSPEILEFFLVRLNPKLSDLRSQEVRDYLEGQIQFLQNQKSESIAAE